MASNLGPFFDDVNLWTYKPTKGREHDFLKKRMALRKARRFRFDDNLGQTIHDLAVAENGDRLREWMALARLPYDAVWLEWDERLDGNITRTGCLMHRMGTDPTRWICETFLYSQAESPDSFPDRYDGRVFPTPLMFVVDTEGRWGESLGHPSAPIPSSKEFPLLLPPGFDILTWGFKDKYDGRKLPKRITVERPWFADHVYTSVEATMGRPALKGIDLDPRMRTDPDFVDGFMEHFVPNVHSAWTSLKFIIVALATINDVPTNMTDVAQRPGSRASGSNRVPYLEHSVVSLRIPAKRPDRWLRRRLDHSVIRKKAHEVRGHWRTYLDRESGEVRRKVWIEAHNRGDPNLGTTRPEFRLSGSRSGMKD